MKQSGLNQQNSKQLIEQAWWAGIDAVNGYKLVTDELNLADSPKPSHVLAVGKAASSMMLAAADQFANSFAGLLVSKYGHIDDRLKSLPFIKTIESAHPRPDENSLLAGERVVNFVNSISMNNELLVLVSGGASSLVEKLTGNLSLHDLQKLTDSMLSTNKTISQINAARSNISMIKKGKLLNHCQAGTITSYAISDVQGDDIFVIGSGIGACDRKNSNAKIIGSNKVARQAAGNHLADNSVPLVYDEESLYGDVHEMADAVVNTIVNGPKGGYVFGGEPVINLPNRPGKGGRNQSLALQIARCLRNQPTIHVLVAGSDGTDGPTDAAGAHVDAGTFIELPGAQQALDSANAYEYLSQVNGLFKTGPTGTNVMDLMIAIKD